MTKQEKSPSLAEQIAALTDTIRWMEGNSTINWPIDKLCAALVNMERLEKLKAVAENGTVWTRLAEARTNVMLSASEARAPAAEIERLRRDANREGFKTAIEKTQPGYRNLWTALRMVRDAVEEIGPVAAVRSRDVDPDPIAEAEAIVGGIKAIEDTARREALEQAAQIAREEKNRAERNRLTDLPSDVRMCWRWSEQTAARIEYGIRALIAPDGRMRNE